MNKLLLYISMMICFASCITERKAVKYMKDHPKVSSAFCATEYPVKETTSIVVVEDSAGARRVKDSLTRYAEQWVKIAEQRNVQLDNVDEFILTLVKDAEEKDSACSATVRSIQAKLGAVPKVDIIALRRSIQEELLRQIIPCKDSIVIRQIENTAKTANFQIKLDEEKAAHSKTSLWKNFWMWIAMALFILNGVQYFMRKK